MIPRQAVSQAIPGMQLPQAGSYPGRLSYPGMQIPRQAGYPGRQQLPSRQLPKQAATSCLSGQLPR